MPRVADAGHLQNRAYGWFYGAYCDSVLVIVAVGIAALAVRFAFWMRLRGSSEAERDGAAGDLARDEQMQTFQRDKARHTGPGLWGS